VTSWSIILKTIKTPTQYIKNMKKKIINTVVFLPLSWVLGGIVQAFFAFFAKNILEKWKESKDK
jgi:hypothetical protein